VYHGSVHSLPVVVGGAAVASESSARVDSVKISQCFNRRTFRKYIQLEPLVPAPALDVSLPGSVCGNDEDLHLHRLEIQ
jgi:hypothetical protein